MSEEIFEYSYKLKGKDASDIRAIKDACQREGLIFSKMITKALLEYFTTGKWGDLIEK